MGFRKQVEPIIKLINMILSKNSINSIVASPALLLPDEHAFALPEKVLQFGTGVLLRGLPDLIIDNANKKGLFNGRIVVVKSTSNGGTDAFDEQDGLYTVCIRGVEDGNKISSDYVVSVLSRVLAASGEWEEILVCATNPEMEVVISNTTELGITLTKDNVHASPPQSFPGKLLAFLYKRFKFFNGDTAKGMVILPTELIPGNAEKLLSIVLELAHQNGLETAFIDWVENANHFCNTLVDRIVPGKLGKEEQARVEGELGYQDGLMIMSEKYALWAIQSGSDKVKEVLSFADGENGVVISPDINKFRELKLRLLNGSHSFSCGLAMLAGFDTVKEAMADTGFTNYITQLMNDAIIPSVVGESISKEEAEQFAQKLLDRYRNPFIEHHWLSITLQYSSKMNMRNVELIKQYALRFGHPSPLMALGMAGHILFLRSTPEADGKYYSKAGDNKYLVTDENAAKYSVAWKENETAETVKAVFDNRELWQYDLNSLPGFADEVTHWLNILIDNGAFFAMQQATAQTTV
jgi:tagaturonate reductase